MTDSILFLRTRASSCRDAAAGVNPCADTDDSAKNVLLDHAKQYDAAADKLEVGMGEWQPIETAPKDGTWIVLLIPKSCQDSNRPKPWVETARWVEDHIESWDQIDENTKRRKFNDYSHWSCYETPTHWQPLPEPPK